MPRARSQDQETWQTAVASETGGGGLPFYALPPIAALFIVAFVTLIALKSPSPSGCRCMWMASNRQRLFPRKRLSKQNHWVRCKPVYIQNTNSSRQFWRLLFINLGAPILCARLLYENA